MADLANDAAASPRRAGVAVRVEQRGAILRLTLDRAGRKNALDPATIAELQREFARVEGASEVRLIQLAAEGSVWCAGADLAAFAADSVGRSAAMHAFADVLADAVACPVPVVAIVNGAVFGGGVGLLCAADFVVMGACGSVSLPESGVGLWPMMVGPMLGRVMSPRRAMQLALTGQVWDAARCLEVGIATSVDADVEASAAVLSASLVAKAPGAVRLGRAAWRAHAALEPEALRARLHSLADSLDALGDLPEAAEGIAAFFGKRTPVW